jgi:hypothetical protein
MRADSHDTRAMPATAERRLGASGEEIMEAVWVAAEMRAGGAYAHSALALDVLAHERAHDAPDVADGSPGR